MCKSKSRMVPIDVDFYKRIFQCPASGRAWEQDGVKLPHGTPIHMSYNSRSHYGIIDDEDWVVEGKRYKSPSAAAMGVARTRKGTQPSLNGWEKWEVKRPSDPEWVSLNSLRPKEAVRRNKAPLSPAEYQRIREEILA